MLEGQLEICRNGTDDLHHYDHRVMKTSPGCCGLSGGCAAGGGGDIKHSCEAGASHLRSARFWCLPGRVVKETSPTHLSEADQERVDNRMKPLSLQQTVEVNGIALWVVEGVGGGGGGGN